MGSMLIFGEIFSSAPRHYDEVGMNRGGFLVAAQSDKEQNRGRYICSLFPRHKYPMVSHF